MVFGRRSRDDDDEDEDEEEEIDLVTFLGALNGNAVDMASNARLAQAALIPAKELVTDGITRRAELIRVEPKGERSQVTMQVDGIAYSGGKLSKQQTLAITQFMKLIAGLEPKLRGRRNPAGCGPNTKARRMNCTSTSLRSPRGSSGCRFASRIRS